jgi:hypothetical protein
MARLARKIGRGHDAIYHGTRHLPLVLRAGKLLPSDFGDTAETRSSARFATAAVAS